MSIQRIGSFKLGPTGSLVEYGAAVTNARINTTRAMQTIPATLATGESSQAAGAIARTLTVDFFSGTAAASIWAELLDAIESDDAEVDFEYKLNDAVVGADNPLFSGTIIVAGLTTGAAVGTLRSQSQTFPLKAGTYAKSVTP
jgi:hypothetical protein